MQRFAIQTLEFDKVKALLADKTATHLGRAAVEHLRIAADLATVEKLQQETAEMQSLLDEGRRLPFGGCVDIVAALKKAEALFRVIEDRCTVPNGYGEAYKADFSPESNEKLSENGVLASRTMNTLLHILECYTELYRAAGNEEVRQAGIRILKRFLNEIYIRDKHQLKVFMMNYNLLINNYQINNKFKK